MSWCFSVHRRGTRVFWVVQTVGKNHRVFYFLPLSISLPPWATSSGNGEGPVSSLNTIKPLMRKSCSWRERERQRQLTPIHKHRLTRPLTSVKSAVSMSTSNGSTILCYTRYFQHFADGAVQKSVCFLGYYGVYFSSTEPLILQCGYWLWLYVFLHSSNTF